MTPIYLRKGTYYCDKHVQIQHFAKHKQFRRKRLRANLKGHCRGNFAIFWSKPLKYLTRSLFFNMKLLIQHWEENAKVFLSEEQTIVIF